LKYARIERERRFLLPVLPDALDPDRGFRRITDTYIPNTRLRLRHVQSEDGTTLQWKLTQKYQTADSPETHTILTNMYLDDAEAMTLRRIPGAVLQKRRYVLNHEGLMFAVDVFEGALCGLIIAECEFPNDAEAAQTSTPPFAAVEITSDPFFRGGRLAFASPEDVHAELRRRLNRETRD